MAVIGIDTSNYTTSIAFLDGEQGENCGKLLPVKQGELGLRQSDAVFAHIKGLPELSGKTIALFGSYGWGDGECMRQWEDTCTNAGAKLACDSVICCGYPDEGAVDGCKKLGAALAHE